ncbi:MAG TPA: hypothetical protein VKB86_03540 [Pyrinomonadaceae bacterium]|nr:hypothetical protein [Pyrinomonadaceae bacterium]
MRSKIQTSIVISLLALLYIGCDPGYELRPVDWQATDAHTWVKDFGDFKIETRGIGGLIGETWVDPDLQIYNNTKPISVVSAELLTAKETFQAKIYGNNAIPPVPLNNGNYHILVTWGFDPGHYTPDVLGNQCEIILNLKVGSEDRQIKIEYEKY